MPEPSHRDYPVETSLDVVRLMDRIAAATEPCTRVKGVVAGTAWVCAHMANGKLLILWKMVASPVCAWYRHTDNEAWRRLDGMMTGVPDDALETEEGQMAALTQAGYCDPDANHV